MIQKAVDLMYIQKKFLVLLCLLQRQKLSVGRGKLVKEWIILLEERFVKNSFVQSLKKIRDQYHDSLEDMYLVMNIF